MKRFKFIQLTGSTLLVPQEPIKRIWAMGYAPTVGFVRVIPGVGGYIERLTIYQAAKIIHNEANALSEMQREFGSVRPINEMAELIGKVRTLGHSGYQNWALDYNGSGMTLWKIFK